MMMMWQGPQRRRLVVVAAVLAVCAAVTVVAADDAAHGDIEITQEMADAYLEEHANMPHAAEHDMMEEGEEGDAHGEHHHDDGGDDHDDDAFGHGLGDMTSDIANFDLDAVDLDGDVAYEPVAALRGMTRQQLEDGLCYAGPAASPTAESWGSLPEGQGTASTTRCEIDIVQAGDISKEQFQEKYVAQNKPCLVRGAGAQWPAMQHWKKDAMLTRYGDLKFKAGFRPPYFEHAIGLREFVQDHVEKGHADAPATNHTHMIWDDVLDIVSRDMNASLASALQEDMDWADTPVVEDAVHVRGNVAFVVAAGCSGTHVHTHPRGFAMLVHGLKRWILHEAPSDKLTEDPFIMHGGQHHILDWFRHYYPKLRSPDHTERALEPGKRHAKVYECFQQPGDLMFIPKNWPHAVLNVLPSVSSSAHAEEDQGTLTHDAFVVADTDKNGFVSPDELKVYLRRDHNLIHTYEGATPDDVFAVAWESFDKNKDGRVSEQELQDTWDVTMDKLDQMMFPNYPKQPPPHPDELEDPHLGHLVHDEL